jgi:ketosteroid isomerase-like protein
MIRQLLMFVGTMTLGLLSACTPAAAPPATAEAPAVTATPSPAEAEEALRQLETERTAALLAEDSTFLERNYAPNYMVIGANGVIRDRAQVIDDLKNGGQTFDELSNDNVTIRIYGDTGVVMGRTTTKGTFRGQPALSPTNFTRVYARENGQWRLVANHASSVAP